MHLLPQAQPAKATHGARREAPSNGSKQHRTTYQDTRALTWVANQLEINCEPGPVG